MTKRTVLLALTAMFLIGAASPSMAAGKEGRVLSDKLVIRLGALTNEFKTDVAAGTSGIAVTVRLEGSALDYDEDLSTAGLSGFYRFGRPGKHSLAFALTKLDRDTSGTLAGELPQFDVSFNGDYNSDFNISLFSLAYRYSFVNTGKTETGISAGLSTYDFEFAIEGDFLVDDGMGGQMQSFGRSSTDVLAPIPNFGFFINHAIRHNLIFQISTQFIDLEVGEHDGRLLTNRASLAWYFTRHVGVGIGLSGTDINYENEDEDDRLVVNYRQSGVTVFVDAVF